MQIIASIVEQHATELAFLWSQRARLAVAPNCRLRELAAVDERLRAHLSGLIAAGTTGRTIASKILTLEDGGDHFALAALALATGHKAELHRVLAASEAGSKDHQRAVIGAFGWTAPTLLREVVAELFASRSVFHRTIALASCAAHAVDPGQALVSALQVSSLCARAAQVAAIIGRVDLLPRVVQALDTMEGNEDSLRLALGALLLGERNLGRARLFRLAMVPSEFQRRALVPALTAADIEMGNQVLKRLRGVGVAEEVVIEGAGYVGDPRYVPWLIGQMENPRLARRAGFAVSLITGVDLVAAELARALTTIEELPDEDSSDEEVAMGDDEALPWPDKEKVTVWWKQRHRMYAEGNRHLCGAPVTAHQCREVLLMGFQPQRAVAALHLKVADPTRRLFEYRAPAWRQQRWLAQMH